MHTDSIHKYIQHPELLDDETLPEVNRLISTFPYFQTAHLLWLKNQHNVKSLDFNENLRRSAAFIADRSQLYHLIHSEDNGDQVVPVVDAGTGPAENEGDHPDTVGPETGDAGMADGMAGKKREEDAGAGTGKVKDMSFTGWLSRMAEDGSGEAPPRQEISEGFSQEFLIDEFIRNAPSIKPPQDGEPDPKDKSEERTENDEQPLTETLAGIYMKQGYLEKALATYEKLSLKYPEKSTYFASRIEEIKAEMSNNKKS
jgi:hypothetical protein